MAVLAVTACAAAFTAGCGDSVMDRKEALESALTDAGLTAEDITITRQELEKEDGKTYYEIAFTSGGYGYYYEIDASSGDVTGVSINAISAGNGSEPAGGQSGESGSGNEPVGEQSGESGSEAQPAGGQSGESGSGNEPASGQSGESGSGAQPAGEQSGESGSGNEPAGEQSREPGGQPGQVDSMDSAKAIVLADAGLAEGEVTFTKEKLDWDDGVAVYDLEFYTADKEYEYEVNAATGTIMDRSEEVFRNPGNQAAGADSLIGEDKAKETAAAHAGFSTEEVFFTKVKLEEEHGRMEYEIEFYKDRVEYECTIDAVAGTVLEYDSEQDD